MAMVLGVDVVVCWVCDDCLVTSVLWFVAFLCWVCYDMCVVLRQAICADLCCWYIQLG